MLAPDVGLLISHGANYLENQPMSVNFMRPDALTLNDLKLATGSNLDALILDEDAWMLDEDIEDEELDAYIHRATNSDAELREPEFFYEYQEEEPDGILVDFNEMGRTYLIEENVGTDEAGEPIHSYITVIGKSSTIYKDKDGFVQFYDNTLVPAKTKNQEVTVASGSNARALLTSIKTTTRYRNAEGVVEIEIPDEMDADNGYVISNDDYTLEVIPTGGSFRNSITLDNAIRFSDVFESVDFQYTVVGDTVKEDIILLEQQNRNEFSYQLRASGLKFKKVGNSVVGYKESYRKPEFRLSAPIMVDADGRTSVALKVKFDSNSNIMTVIADKDWLNDPERSYPVRIDPGAELVGYEAFTVNMIAKGDNRESVEKGIENDPEIYNEHYGDTGHTMVGYSEYYGHCRAVIDIDTAWESLIGHPATQAEDGGPGVKNVQFSIGVMTKEIDILADTTVWEVKPVTYLFPGKSIELKDAIAQIQSYADNAAGRHKGTSAEFPGVYNEKLFGDFYMSVDTADFYANFKIGNKETIAIGDNLEGLLFYSLSRGGGEGSLVPVSIPVTVQSMEENRNAALLVFASIAGVTLLQDVITWGAGVLDDIVTLTAAATVAVAILVR